MKQEMSIFETKILWLIYEYLENESNGNPFKDQEEYESLLGEMDVEVEFEVHDNGYTEPIGWEIKWNFSQPITSDQMYWIALAEEAIQNQRTFPSIF